MTKQDYLDEFDRRVECCLAAGDLEGIEELYQIALKEGALEEGFLDEREVAL